MEFYVKNKWNPTWEMIFLLDRLTAENIQIQKLFLSWEIFSCLEMCQNDQKLSHVLMVMIGFFSIELSYENFQTLPQTLHPLNTNCLRHKCLSLDRLSKSNHPKPHPYAWTRKSNVPIPHESMTKVLPHLDPILTCLISVLPSCRQWLLSLQNSS